MHRPILPLSAASLLLTKVLGSCSKNECFQALNDAPSQIVTSDCKSFFGDLAALPTTTVVETIDATTTDKFTRTNTETITLVPTDVASGKWEDRRRVRNILLRRTTPSSTVETTTILPQTPKYASPCSSSDAYSSGCSCFGITSAPPTTTEIVTAQKSSVVTKIATIVTTHTLVVFSNSSALFGNSTAARFVNSTAVSRNATGSRSASLLGLALRASSSVVSGGISSAAGSSQNIAIEAENSSGATTFSSRIGSSAKSSSSATATGSANLVNATKASWPRNGTAPSPNATNTPTLGKSMDSWDYGNETSSALFQNTAAAGPHPAANATKLAHSTTSAHTNITHASSAPYLHVTTSSWRINSTAPAPFRNATVATLLNQTTSAPFLNTTSLPALNTTRAPFLNMTSIPALNTTRAPFANTTSRMFANSTSVRFSNTSTPVPTTTATSTLDQSCGQTTTPFLLQVQQPDGMFDGWYLHLSGDAILFTSSANYSSRFSVESSGHLCVVGYLGASGNPAIAIAETKDGLTGSAIYFVDGARLTRYLGARGYGALTCAVSDDSLGCRAGRDLGHWVACGLGLDISSDGAPSVVVDTWNCTSLGLSAVFVSVAVR